MFLSKKLNFYLVNHSSTQEFIFHKFFVFYKNFLFTFKWFLYHNKDMSGPWEALFFFYKLFISLALLTSTLSQVNSSPPYYLYVCAFSHFQTKWLIFSGFCHKRLSRCHFGLFSSLLFRFPLFFLFLLLFPSQWYLLSWKIIALKELRIAGLRLIEVRKNMQVIYLLSSYFEIYW